MTANAQTIYDDTADLIADVNVKLLDYELAADLGCPTSRDPYGLKIPSMDTLGSDQIEALKVCIPQVFMKLAPRPAEPYNMITLLSGMHRYDCWRACLSTEDSTYAFAIAILVFVENFSWSREQDIGARVAVKEIVNAWLSPDNPWQALPGVGVLCEHMFGAAWCAMVMPDAAFSHVPGDDMKAARMACYLVERQRPPFLLGVCPAQKADAGIVLPAEIGL
jgi:hypothetical protein